MTETNADLLEQIDGLMRRAVDLTAERDQARAEAVAATTRYDDLRHRIKAAKAVHVHTLGFFGVPLCGGCDRRWPCPTIRAMEAGS